MAGYKEIREMWGDLIVDLEKHDKYVGAFPKVFDVVKRLQGARPWNLYHHKQNGGKVVGTYCVYVPDEIIYALGAASIGLCGGDQFWAPAGRAVLPTNMCALAASSVGSRLAA